MSIEDYKVSKIVTRKPVVQDNKVQFVEETVTFDQQEATNQEQQ